MKIGKAKAVITVIIPTLLLTGCMDRSDINIMDYSHKDPVPLEWDNDAGNFRNQIKDLLDKLGINVYDNTSQPQGDTPHEQALYTAISKVDFIESSVERSTLDFYKQQEYDHLMKSRDDAKMALAGKAEEQIIMSTWILNNLTDSWDEYIDYDFTPTTDRTEDQERVVLKNDIQNLISEAKDLINSNTKNDYITTMKKTDLESRIKFAENLINGSNYDNTSINDITVVKTILSNLIENW